MPILSSIRSLSLVLLGMAIGYFAQSIRSGQDEPQSDKSTTHQAASTDAFINTILSENDDKDLDLEQEKLKQNTATQPPRYPKAANKLIEQGEGILNDAMLSVLVARWAEEDPMAALEFVLSKHKPMLETLILSIAGKQQSEDVLQWLTNQTQTPQYSYWAQAYFQGMAEHAPSLALQYAQGQPAGEIRNNVTAAIVEQWSKHDIDAVLEWLDDKHHTPLGKNLYQNALIQYIQQAPWEASLELTNMENRQGQAQLVSVLADTLSRDDVQGALEWAESLDGAMETQALASILSNWSTQGHAEDALQYVLSRGDIDSNNEAFISTVINVASSNPNLLKNRITEFAPSDQIVVIHHLANSLSNLPDNSYDNWVTTLPHGEQRDTALVSGVRAMAYIDAQKAYRLAESIDNAEKRLANITLAIRKMWQQNPSEARAIINTSNTLSEEQKQHLIADAENE